MTCLACESQSQRIENEYRSVQVARDVELEELWTLYEDTGFLYPEKIERLRSSLPEIHHTIGALLRANGDLLETVTTRLDGTLSGHLVRCGPTGARGSSSTSRRAGGLEVPAS